MIVINNKVRQIDSTLDEILDINIIIDKRVSQSDITFDQVMLSRFMKMKGVDNKEDEETFKWWINRY